MKKKIKLRDLTLEQYREYKKDACYGTCSKCIFGNVNCSSVNDGCWIYHKDLYSDKFLDQEVEIETPTFTDKEKKYLHNLLEPYKDNIKLIRINRTVNSDWAFLQFHVEVKTPEKVIDYILLPRFKVGTMFKDLKVDRDYKGSILKTLLKELELL